MIWFSLSPYPGNHAEVLCVATRSRMALLRHGGKKMGKELFLPQAM